MRASAVSLQRLLENAKRRKPILNKVYLRVLKLSCHLSVLSQLELGFEIAKWMISHAQDMEKFKTLPKGAKKTLGEILEARLFALG